MRGIKKVLVFMFSIYGLLVFVLIMLVLFPFVMISSFFGKKGKTFGFSLLKLWSSTFHLFAFLPVRRKISPEIDHRKSYIYVCNHSSFLDATIVPMSVPGTVLPLGKKELKKMPMVGWVIARFAVFVDRSDKESRRKSVEKLVELAKEGNSIFIFPEGTMNRTNRILQDFYKGAFRIAKETNLPLVPMVIHNSGKKLPPASFSLRPGQIEVEIGEPLTSEEHSIEELLHISRKWILNKLEAKQAS